MSQEQIIDRVRKLLALAQSDNVHEAANAAAQAQKLMSKHAIEEAALTVEDDEDDDEPITNDVLAFTKGSRIATWKLYLASNITEANGCSYYYRNGLSKFDKSRISIVGRASDATKCRYLFAYITKEIDRLTKQESKARGGAGRTWCNSFRLGAQAEVGKRIREATEQAGDEMRELAAAQDRVQGTGSTALVRINSAIEKIEKRKTEAHVWMHDKLNLGKGNARPSAFDGAGYAAGKRAGASININSSGPALGSGTRKALKS